MRTFLVFYFSVLIIATPTATAQATTAFTYQGQLQKDEQPFTGTIASSEISFELFDGPDSSASSSIAGPINPDNDVQVTDGLFQVELDFGQGAFDGSERYLEIVVSGATLSPRQKITGAPSAQLALEVAPGSVGSNEVADGSIGGADVDAAEVQLRVGSSCSAGSSIRQINADGTVECEADDSGGNIDSVTAGDGLSGGGDGGAITISVADEGITSRMIADRGVGTDDIALRSILGIHIQEDDITSLEIRNSGVETVDLAGGAVTSPKIKNGEVKNFDLANDAVTGDKVADGSLSKADLGDSGCTRDQIMRWDSASSAWICSPDRSTPTHFGRFGGNGSDGSLTVSQTSSLPSGSHQFTELIVESSGILQLDGWTIIGVQGTCEIRGLITAAGSGASGAERISADGHSANPFPDPDDQPVAGAISGAGGSGGNTGTACPEPGYVMNSGKGGGAAGLGGQPRSGDFDNGGSGPLMDPSILIGPNGRADHVFSALQYRGAGGGGGSCVSNNEACANESNGGGNGGGVVYLECGSLIFGENVFDSGDAKIDVSGDDGSTASCFDPDCCLAEGGGGGGGGVAIVRTKAVNLATGIVDHSGGAGGSGDGSGSADGAVAPGGTGADGYSVIINVQTNSFISTNE